MDDEHPPRRRIFQYNSVAKFFAVLILVVEMFALHTHILILLPRMAHRGTRGWLGWELGHSWALMALLSSSFVFFFIVRGRNTQMLDCVEGYKCKIFVIWIYLFNTTTSPGHVPVVNWKCDRVWISFCLPTYDAFT